MLGACYILLWFLFSNVVLVNLLVSVIVDSFGVTDTLSSIHEEGGIFGMRKQLRERWRWFKAAKLRGREDLGELPVAVAEQLKDGGRGQDDPLARPGGDVRSKAHKEKDREVSSVVDKAGYHLKLPQGEGSAQQHGRASPSFDHGQHTKRKLFSTDFVFTMEYGRLASAAPSVRAPATVWIAGRALGTPLPSVPVLRVGPSNDVGAAGLRADEHDMILVDVEEDEAAHAVGDGLASSAAKRLEVPVDVEGKRQKWRRTLPISDGTASRGQSLSMAFRNIKMRGVVRRMEALEVLDSPTDSSNKTFFIFGRDSIVWKVFHALTQSLLFQYIMHLSVLASSIVAIITPPHGDLSVPSPLYVLSQEHLDLLELVFNIVFTAEMFALIMIQGFIMGERAYLRDVLHCLDALIVSLTWIDYLGLLDGYGGARTLRMLRVLKPLRAIKRNRGEWSDNFECVSTLARREAGSAVATLGSFPFCLFVCP